MYETLQHCMIFIDAIESSLIHKIVRNSPVLASLQPTARLVAAETGEVDRSTCLIQ